MRANCHRQCSQSWPRKAGGQSGGQWGRPEPGQASGRSGASAASAGGARQSWSMLAAASASRRQVGSRGRGSSSRWHRRGSKRGGGARLIHTYRHSDAHQGKGKGHAGPQRKALHDHSPKSNLLLLWHVGLAIHCEWLRLAHHGRLVGDRVPVVGSCSAGEEPAGEEPARGCGWKM
jgi:hypothetical protein